MPINEEDLDAFEQEKQRIVEIYQKQVIARKDEIADLKVKIENLEEIFKTAFAAKIEEVERRFKELEADQAAFVLKKNEHTEKEQVLAQRQRDHEHNVEEDLVKISKLRDEANSLMNDARAQAGHIRDDVSRNSAILEETKAQRLAFEGSRETYGDEKARIEQDLNAAAGIKARAGDILREAERIQREANEKTANATQQLSGITVKREDAQKLLKECDEAITMAAARKLEVDALMEESNEKIKQITREREKNNNDKIALRAKEITLNEKEQKLNEREKNIKIIQETIQ